MTVSETFLIFDELDSVKDYGEVSVGCSTIRICLKFFSWLGWGYGFEEKDHRVKMSFLSHYIKCTYYQHDLALLVLTLITWLIQYLSDFSTVQLLFFSPVSVLYALEESHSAQPTLPCCSSLRRGVYINYLRFFMEDLLILSHLFNLPISVDLQMLIPWVIIEYYYILFLSFFLALSVGTPFTLHPYAFDISLLFMYTFWVLPFWECKIIQTYLLFPALAWDQPFLLLLRKVNNQDLHFRCASCYWGVAACGFSPADIVRKCMCILVTLYTYL